MKRFEAFLTEKETEAHKKAKAMGLEYRGFGYWADRNTGEITHRSSGDELTPTKGLEAKDGDKKDPTAAGAAGEAPMGGPMGAGGAPAQLGEVKPGEEKAPRDLDWRSGPDGSTDVGQDKDPVEADVFVPKDEDSDNWISGPEGSNIKNFSFDTFKESVLVEASGMPAAQEAKLRNLTSDGHGMWFDTKGTPVARTLDGELEWLSPKEIEQENAKVIARNMRKEPGVEMTGDPDAQAGAKFMQKIPAGKRTNMMHDYLKDKGLAPEVVDPKLNPMAAQAKVPAPAAPEGGADSGDKSTGGFPGREKQIDLLKKGEAPKGAERTFNDARAALDKMSPEEREKALADLAKTKDNSFAGKKQGEYTKGMQSYKDIQKLPAKGKDLEKVKKMNEVTKQFISDPDYDMGESNRYMELGEGAFGTVYRSRDLDHVIKEGDIGRDELNALFLMKDHPAFPTLVNAEFTAPFKHESSAYNNPMDVDDERADSQGRYFDPNNESDFERKFITAKGTYAMTEAKGNPFSDSWMDFDETEHSMVAENFWKNRADLHRAGISHGDMHGGNIFVDPNTYETSILDLGLAQVSKLAALMEAMGGLSGEDYQLTELLGTEYLSEENKIQLEENYERLKEKIQEDYQDAVDGGEMSRYYLEEFVLGGIRLSDDELGEHMLNLEPEEEQLQGYIDMLYEGIGEPVDKKTDLERRMAKAWEGLWDEVGQSGGYEGGEGARGIIKNANWLRKERGEKPINIKGLDLEDDD